MLQNPTTSFNAFTIVLLTVAVFVTPMALLKYILFPERDIRYFTVNEEGALEETIEEDAFYIVRMYKSLSLPDSLYKIEFVTRTTKQQFEGVEVENPRSALMIEGFCSLQNNGEILPQGIWKFYKDSLSVWERKLKRTVEYVNGTLEGRYEVYFPDCDQIEWEGVYKSGFRNGIFRNYRKNGATEIERYYKNDLFYVQGYDLETLTRLNSFSEIVDIQYQFNMASDSLASDSLFHYTQQSFSVDPYNLFILEKYASLLVDHESGYYNPSEGRCYFDRSKNHGHPRPYEVDYFVFRSLIIQTLEETNILETSNLLSAMCERAMEIDTSYSLRDAKPVQEALYDEILEFHIAQTEVLISKQERLAAECENPGTYIPTFSLGGELLLGILAAGPRLVAGFGRMALVANDGANIWNMAQSLKSNSCSESEQYSSIIEYRTDSLENKPTKKLIQEVWNPLRSK